MKTSADLSTKAFYALLISVALLIVSMFFSTEIQKMMMRRFHLRDSSFVCWSFLQFVPSMYNFSNQVEIKPGLPVHQINHFPLRVVTFNPEIRQMIIESDQHFKVTLSSHYRDTTLTTLYDLEARSPLMVFHYADNNQ